jgi:hypothetical protein
MYLSAAEDLRVAVLVLQGANALLIDVERRYAQAFLDEPGDESFSDPTRGPCHNGHFSCNVWISHWVSPSLRFLPLIRAAALSLAALGCDPNS